jgi:eukaryotic-like serine/threonine-protein kinase
MTHETPTDLHYDARLNEALVAYDEALHDRQQLLEAYPDLRPDLEEFFAGHDEVERLAAPLRKDAFDRDLESPPAPIEFSPAIGQLGDFQLVREIGRGGMGVVYEALQVSLDRRVALKLLPFAAAMDPRQMQRFRNEARAAAHLRHENIVPVFAVGEERGVHYYAMQLVEGRSLAALISELRGPPASGGSNSNAGPGMSLAGATSPAAVRSTERSAGKRRYFDWVANVGRQAALALHHAHSVGIVHRDVKPANLLLDQQGLLLITDFGLAQMAGDAGLTQTGEWVGTLRYASPEQVLARRGVVDHRSDVYSLGATLYELLTLRPIFGGTDRIELVRQIAEDEPLNPCSLHPSTPRELETVVLRSLAKDPAERYGTAGEMADDLQRFLDNRPVLARRPSAGERLRRIARRHPSLVVAGLVALVLLTVGSLTSALLIRGEQERTKAEQRKSEEAYRRERQRAEEAEARFRLARRSVDEMFRLSQEELADRPGLEGLRKRMLWSVLAFYKEFLEQRRDDPEASADLLDAKQYVEKILADLTLLRAASQLYLLGQGAVCDDMRITDAQRPGITEFCARVGKEWRESLGEVGRVSPAERGRRAVERARTYEAAVNELLTPAQRLRLRQLALQAEGPGSLGEPEMVSELKLTLEQREQIRTIEEEALWGWMRGPQAGKPPGAPEHTTNDRILAVLTEEQRGRWKALTGAPAKLPIVQFGAAEVRGQH